MSTQPIPGVQPTILSGWKDIANYLGMAVRTVQRYERDLGLPIRRAAPKSKRPVIARKVELDGWITAMPIRGLRPVLENAPLLKEFRRQITEMHRLRQEATAVRKELIESLQLLRNNLRSAAPRPDSVEPPSRRRASQAEILSFDSTKKRIQ